MSPYGDLHRARRRHLAQRERRLGFAWRLALIAYFAVILIAGRRSPIVWVAFFALVLTFALSIAALVSRCRERRR